MLTNHDSNSNIDGLTDREVYAAIRYLDIDGRPFDRESADDAGIDYSVAICVCLSVALLLVNLWFYWPGQHP